jgi:isocitrate dehydrogenase
VGKEVTQERMESALDYLVSTDFQFAELDGQVKNAENRVELAKEIAYARSEGANIKEREAKAVMAETYQNALDEHTKAYIEFKKVKAKRDTAQVLIDVWRSLNAARRQG